MELVVVYGFEFFSFESVAERPSDVSSLAAPYRNNPDYMTASAPPT
jgi:hypothetical protein